MFFISQILEIYTLKALTVICNINIELIKFTVSLKREIQTNNRQTHNFQHTVNNCKMSCIFGLFLLIFICHFSFICKYIIQFSAIWIVTLFVTNDTIKVLS